MANHLIQKIKHFDERRPEIPGEHWVAFFSGVGLWLATRKHPSMPVRIAAGIAGGLLVARAAQGRKVPHALRKWMPYTG